MPASYTLLSKKRVSFTSSGLWCGWGENRFRPLLRTSYPGVMTLDRSLGFTVSSFLHLKERLVGGRGRKGDGTGIKMQIEMPAFQIGFSGFNSCIYVEFQLAANARAGGQQRRLTSLGPDHPHGRPALSFPAAWI